MYWGHFLWEQCGHWSSAPVSGLDHVAGGKIDSPVRSTAVECLPKVPGVGENYYCEHNLVSDTAVGLCSSQRVFFLRISLAARTKLQPTSSHPRNFSSNVAICLLRACVSLTSQLSPSELQWARAWPHAVPGQRPSLALTPDFPPLKKHILPLFNLRWHIWTTLHI